MTDSLRSILTRGLVYRPSYMDYAHSNPGKHGFVNKVVDRPYSCSNRYVRLGGTPRAMTVELLSTDLVNQQWWAQKDVPTLPGYGEVELGRQVRSAGAKWNRDQKLWEITYGDVVALGLEERIVPGAR